MPPAPLSDKSAKGYAKDARHSETSKDDGDHRPSFSGGMTSLATDIASAIKTPVTTAVIILDTRSRPYDPDKAVTIFPTINMLSKTRMSGNLENRLNNAVKTGVPIAKVSAKAVTRKPAVDMAIFISVATSDNNPTIKNSLVPRIKVNKNKFIVKNFCCLVNIDSPFLSKMYGGFHFTTYSTRNCVPKPLPET